MKWERSDLQAAKVLKELILNHSFMEFKGSSIVNSALAIQWLNKLIEYFEVETTKPPEIKNPEIKEISTPEGPKNSGDKLRSKSK